MRIKNLLLLCAFLLISGGGMAQTTLTATNVKVVSGYESQNAAVISFEVPATIGGWQMVLSLPEGLLLESTSGNLVIGPSSETPSTATADLFKSVTLSNLHKNHSVIGGSNKDGDILLVCVPTESEEAIGAKSGQLCSIKLKAASSFTTPAVNKNEPKKVTIKSFTAADPQGSTTLYNLADEITFDVQKLWGDANGDGKVNMPDARTVKNKVAQGSTDIVGDANDDGKLTMADCRAIKLEVNLYE